jgi:hypothetical protein
MLRAPCCRIFTDRSGPRNASATFSGSSQRNPRDRLARGDRGLRPVSDRQLSKLRTSSNSILTTIGLGGDRGSLIQGGH